jgi:hypothetical protein
MRTGTFYLSFAPGPDRQPITLPGGGVAYIRVVESALPLDAALDIEPPPDEHLLNVHELAPQPRLRDEPLLTMAIRLLKVTPYLTSVELSLRLDANVSTISSLLYRDMIKPNNRVTRREAQLAGRGWEWYVVGVLARHANLDDDI